MWPKRGLLLIRSDSVNRVKRGRFPQQDEQGTAASSLKRNLNVWSVDFKSRPPHACFECSLYYQVSFDWTTSFLSDVLIINPEDGSVKLFLKHFESILFYWLSVKVTSTWVTTSTGFPFSSVGL